MIVVQKAADLDPAMKNALKSHIMRKRQQLKQELEQDAIERRLKREMEQKRRKDAMTLDQIKEQVNELTTKLKNLHDEKDHVFAKLKRVLNDHDARRKQMQAELIAKQQQQMQRQQQQLQLQQAQQQQLQLQQAQQQQLQQAQQQHQAQQLAQQQHQAQQQAQHQAHQQHQAQQQAQQQAQHQARNSHLNSMFLSGNLGPGQMLGQTGPTTPEMAYQQLINAQCLAAARSPHHLSLPYGSQPGGLHPYDNSFFLARHGLPPPPPPPSLLSHSMSHPFGPSSMASSISSTSSPIGGNPNMSFTSQANSHPDFKNVMLPGHYATMTAVANSLGIPLTTSPVSYMSQTPVSSHHSSMSPMPGTSMSHASGHLSNRQSPQMLKRPSSNSSIGPDKSSSPSKKQQHHQIPPYPGSLYQGHPNFMPGPPHPSMGRGPPLPGNFSGSGSGGPPPPKKLYTEPAQSPPRLPHLSSPFGMLPMPMRPYYNPNSYPNMNQMRAPLPIRPPPIWDDPLMYPLSLQHNKPGGIIAGFPVQRRGSGPPGPPHPNAPH